MKCFHRKLEAGINLNHRMNNTEQLTLGIPRQVRWRVLFQACPRTAGDVKPVAVVNPADSSLGSDTLHYFSGVCAGLEHVPSHFNIASPLTEEV
jgi:hypothetical protein